MIDRAALYLQDAHDLRDGLEIVKYAEKNSYPISIGQIRRYAQVSNANISANLIIWRNGANKIRTILNTKKQKMLPGKKPVGADRLNGDKIMPNI